MRGASLVCALLAATPAVAGPLYIEAGKLIDVASGVSVTGQCILTQDERIARIEPCGATPEGSERVDWSGFTVIPGLIDLHTHLADAEQEAEVADAIDQERLEVREHSGRALETDAEQQVRHQPHRY